MKRTIFVLALAAACGGSHQKNQAFDPESGDSSGGYQPTVQGSGGPVGNDTSGSMISPDKMDETERDLNRKSMVMSQCLAEAMENGDAKRGAHGKVALEIVIDNGKASSIKVIKSDFQSQAINDCVIKHVREIEFPHMVKPYETSHTYAMEAN
jgi:hypothetical protein